MPVTSSQFDRLAGLLRVCVDLAVRIGGWPWLDPAAQASAGQASAASSRLLIDDTLDLELERVEHARPGDTTRRVEAGLSGYAVKPVSHAHLLRPVCEAMETRPVNPARILVVDDLPDNRLLVQMFLKGSPYQLSFEANGKAAVDRFATSDFDLILMDVQMPVMDGLAATRAIRALERERGTPAIPIIALTAHASLQDIGRSASAGCNAHVSKPVSKLELLTAIEKHRRQLKPVEMEPSESLAPIGIETPSGLEDILPGYLASRRKELPEMVELLAASDFARLAFLGHNLKGTATGYGFPDLTRLGAALERSAEQADCGTLRTLMTELGNYLDQVQLIARS
jgi:CheY-like chemotaxis protein/HPt (histidine-containing phosphotransfer) domain-containing protein